MRKPFLQPQTPTSVTERHVLTVSQLNKDVKSLLEKKIGSVWIEGEISNFIKAASGHWYFSLKDRNAQIKCALFKFKNSRLDFLPKEGDQVVVKGKISLYEARGDYQLIADYMEPAGLGDLQLKLNQLISKLQNDGLFSSDSKLTLPKIPKSIGVITSPTGAAIHDVLTVLKRRCPMIPIIIYPTLVQGINAAEQIINAVKTAESRNECDVLLITRGGGSLEDLWSFNDEKLAHTIDECAIPIVAAIGHEVDTTITELVADLRAATPSAAAELLSPDQNVLAQKIDILFENLQSNLQQIVLSKKQQLHLAKIKLKAPENKLSQYHHKIENIKQRMFSQQQALLNISKNRLLNVIHKLERQDPKEQLKFKKQELKLLNKQLTNHFKTRLNKHKNDLGDLANQLNLLSPLSTLSRGYSITKDRNSGKILNKKSDFNQRQEINILLSDGVINATVE